MKTRIASFVAAGLLSSVVAPVGAQVPSPAIEGPVSGGLGAPFVATTTFDLADVGYMQEEFFISGTASSYTNVGPLTADGVWTVAPAETADYRTRVLVYRPVKRKRFNGTVLVEWLNVSGGIDSGPDWIALHTELIRSGYAWMGVSAQLIGVEGGVSVVGLPSQGLKEVDPVRYASLTHPGDSFSYDIFSQAGQAILQPSDVDPLGDLKVKRVIAVGESQSAFRLVTYVNGIDPLARVYDGFFVHSRGNGSAALSETPQASIVPTSPSLIRPDARVPVLTFQTETDMDFLGFFNARQPDHDMHRLWEVAGTAHADTYTVLAGMTDVGKDPSVAGLIVNAAPLPGLIECPFPLNSGPQHWVAKAALDALHRWVKKGKAPPSAPRLEVMANPAITIMRDEHGNALGGIRTPAVDVPIAELSGGGQVGSILCILFGTTVPFDDAKLASLYPTHKAFVSAFKKATKQAKKARYILKKDAKLMIKWAKQSDIGG